MTLCADSVAATGSRFVQEYLPILMESASRTKRDTAVFESIWAELRRDESMELLALGEAKRIARIIAATKG